MNNSFKCYALLGLITTLAACQTVDPSGNSSITAAKDNNGKALVSCSGTAKCEFERVNNTKIVDATTHKIDKRAIKEGIVRLNIQSLNDPNAIYVSVPAGQNEVVIRFYPVSDLKAETLHIIHEFKAHHTYVLHMFRNRSNRSESLLDASNPGPLCVDMQEDQRKIRRFCKTLDPSTGLGEFVEQKKFKSR